jgi:hypothetical protein
MLNTTAKPGERAAHPLGWVVCVRAGFHPEHVCTNPNVQRNPLAALVVLPPRTSVNIAACLWRKISANIPQCSLNGGL